MIVIGIILLLLGLTLGGFVVAGGLPGREGTDVSFGLFGLTVDTSLVVVFALGALTLLLLELGFLALRSGARKSARRRAELQRLRRVEAEVQARQASEAEQRQAAAPPAPAPAPFARRDPDPTRPPVHDDADEHRGSDHGDRPDVGGEVDRDGAEVSGSTRSDDVADGDRGGRA